MSVRHVHQLVMVLMAECEWLFIGFLVGEVSESGEVCVCVGVPVCA